MMANQAPWYLTVQKGPNPGRVYSLPEGIITIGRHTSDHITIDDARVSRHHVRLTRQGNTVQVEDMGSANGTFVNNIRINGPVQLREEDAIGLSQDIVFRFSRSPVADDATVLVSSHPASVAAAPPPPVDTPPKGGPNWLTLVIAGIMGLIILVLMGTAASLIIFRNNSAALSQSSQTATATPIFTPTPVPTYTPYPTYTPVPTEAATATPYPTYTPVPTAIPTATPYPTYTPFPTPPPTATPYPTYTPAPPKIVVVEATQPLPIAAPISLPTATPAAPPFVLELGRNVGYEPWGKPGDPDGCGPPYDDRIEVRRFTAEVLLTNNSKQLIGEDWWPTMLSASGAPVPSCWFYYNNVVVEPGETTDVTYTSYLPKGDYVKAMVFPILGQTAMICLGPNGQEVTCP